MNERIKQIKTQAMCCYDGVNWEFDEEMFAELIVKQCISVGEQYADGLIDMDHYAFVNKKIKEHFGVK